jgi:hypothetical protein
MSCSLVARALGEPHQERTLGWRSYAGHAPACWLEADRGIALGGLGQLESRPFLFFMPLFTEVSGRKVSEVQVYALDKILLTPAQTHTSAQGISQSPGGLFVLTSQSALRQSTTISRWVSSSQRSRKRSSSSGSSDALRALSALITLFAHGLNVEISIGEGG